MKRIFGDKILQPGLAVLHSVKHRKSGSMCVGQHAAVLNLMRTSPSIFSQSGKGEYVFVLIFRGDVFMI